MAEPTLDQFLADIGVATNTPTARPQPQTQEPISLIPLSTEALVAQKRKIDAGRVERVLPSKNADADYATRLGARPGVPFDTQSGISFMSRLRAAAQPTPEEEVKALEAAYGAGNVRKNSYGWLVVTKPDKDGKATDYLVDPIGLEAGDAAGVLAQLPEIGASILTTIATRGASVAPGIWNAAKTLLAMSSGAAAGGATKDILVRAAEGEDLRPGEIGARRGTEAILDAAVGTTMGVGGKALGAFITPLSNPGPIQFEARKAQEYFASKYGVRLPMTPGEATGNTFLQRAEAMQSQKPGASGAFERLIKNRDARLAELQRIAVGGAVPDEEAAGQRALAALGAKVAPLEQNVQRAAFDTAQSAEKELLGGVGSSVDKTNLGGSIRARAIALREEFQTKRNSLYSDVYADPRTKVKNIEGDELADAAGNMLDKLPTVQQEVSQPAANAPFLGGYTLAKDVATTDAVLTEFTETGVVPKLRALVRGRGQQFRLDELQQMRTAVDNDIAQGEAVPGVQTRQLTQIRAMLTDRIKKGLEEIDPGLLKKWEDANDFVAENIGKFKKAGIAEIFRDPEQLSFIGDSGLVTRVTEGRNAQDIYRAYKDFFGPASTEVKGIQQAIRDDVLGKSNLSSTLDAKGFVRRLEALDKDAPDALVDAFGAAQAKELRSAAMSLRVAQGDNLPANEIQEALVSGNLSAKKLQELLSAQATKDQAYRNEIVRAVSEGNLKPDSIRPTEFVNRLVFKKTTQPSDVENVIKLLGDRPEVVEDIRRLTFQRALDEATAVQAATGKRTIVADDLEKMLSDENTAKRLKIALGPSTFEDLSRLKDFLKPGAIVQQAAKSAGGLSTGAQVAGLVEQGSLRYVSRAVKNFTIATLYTNPAIRRWLSNTALESRGKANLANAMIASTPFVEAVSSTFSDEAGRKVMAELKSSIDQTVRENPAEEAAQEPTVPEFLRSIGMQP